MIGFKSGKQIAVDGKKKIFIAPDTEYPEQGLNQSPLQRVDDKDLLRVFTKYKLSRDDVNLLTTFYSQTETSILDLKNSNWRLHQAFIDVEHLVLESLKTVYYGTKIKPLFSGRLAVCFQGSSNSGKTWMATDILNTPEYVNKKCYVISANANDPSLTKLNKIRKNKNNIFLNIDKITEPLNIKMFPKEDCILLIDDVFDSLGGHDPRKKIIADLVREVLTKGRHYKSKPSQIGMSVIIILHNPMQGAMLSSLFIECKTFVTFPSKNSSFTKKFLQNKLALSKKDMDPIFQEQKGRFLLFSIPKPQFCIAENFVRLL